MLKQVTISNFQSWLSAKFEPRDVNLLLGSNNAGKSNFIRALSFISLSSRDQLDKCLFDIGVPAQFIQNFGVRFDDIEFGIQCELPGDEVETLEFEYKLHLGLTTDAFRNGRLEVRNEQLYLKTKSLDRVNLIRREGDKVVLLNERRYRNNESLSSVETTCPDNVTMLSRLYDLQTNTSANRFKKYLQSWQYYDLSPERLRQSVHTPNLHVLNPLGDNLSSVVYLLKKQDERAYRKLLEFLRVLEPELEYINFTGGENEPSVNMWFEYTSGKRLPVWLLSGGSLRYLALAYVLFAQPTLEIRPLIFIEEPENGLHVSHLRSLIHKVFDLSTGAQVMFSSHSPYFIDSFDSKLDCVFVVQKEIHQSTITPIDSIKARKLLSEFPLGEQHFRNLL